MPARLRPTRRNILKATASVWQQRRARKNLLFHSQTVISPTTAPAGSFLTENSTHFLTTEDGLSYLSQE